MKKIIFSIISLSLIFKVNAQFEDDWASGPGDSFGEVSITPDSIDKSSYLDELIIFNDVGAKYLLKNNNEQLFWESYAKRFIKSEDLDDNSIINNSSAVKKQSKIKDPKKFNSQNLVFHSLDFTKITNTLLQELEVFTNLKWQNVFQMKLLNSELIVIERPLLKQDYLTDSLVEYTYLPIGMDPDDPASYELKYFKYLTMKPYDLFVQMKDKKPYIEFRFMDAALKSIFIDPREIPKEYGNIQFLLGSRYFNKYLSENLSESYTHSLKSLITNYFDNMISNIPFSANDFTWMYIHDGVKLSPPMDLDEFQYNASYFVNVMKLIEGEDPDDPESYTNFSMPISGELTNEYNEDPYGRIESVSIIQENNLQKNRNTTQIIGLLFNNRNAVMFDDSIEEFSKSDIDFFTHLYKMSYGSL